MLKFRNIALLSCVFSGLCAAELSDSEGSNSFEEKRAHLEQTVLNDSSLSETETNSEGRDSLSSINETLSTESTITSEDSIQDKVALILEKIPTQGVSVFRGVTQEIIDAAVDEFAWVEIVKIYKNNPDTFLSDLKYIDDAACYQMVMIAFGTQYGFDSNDSYTEEHHNAIREIFRNKKNIDNIYDQLPI